MQALSRREETEVVEKAKKEALKVCDDYVRGSSAPRKAESFSMTMVLYQISQSVLPDGHSQLPGLVRPNSTLGHNVCGNSASLLTVSLLILLLLITESLVLTSVDFPSVTEDRLNEMKLDYIAHRGERGQEALEELRRKGEENFKRMGGKKVEVRV